MMPEAHEIIPGPVVLDQVLPPGRPWAGVVKRGQVLRLVDLEGSQAVDFLCYNTANPEERYNAADTMKIQGNVFISKGTVLYSGLANPFFTVIEDTCGRHDTIAGCCSGEGNQLRFGVKGAPNCRDNFLEVLKPYGLGYRDIVANINFFMSAPVGPDGAMAIVASPARPGDFVDMRAEMDTLVAISNCPQVLYPATGSHLTPVRVVVWEPA